MAKQTEKLPDEEDEPAKDAEVLTPNQIREREEHERAVRKNFDGKMPDGYKHPKKIGGYIGKKI